MCGKRFVFISIVMGGIIIVSPFFSQSDDDEFQQQLDKVMEQKLETAQGSERSNYVAPAFRPGATPQTARPDADSGYRAPYLGGSKP